MAEKLKRALGLRDVFLFYIVSGLSLRWIATAAATGQSAIAVWVLAWFGFFLPLAACVLELSSRFPQEGGLYVWTREAFGDFSGFIAGWTYWMSNLPYFPAVLGLWMCPTIVNNVETLCNVKHIVALGGAEFAKLGTPNNTGTRIVSLSGHVKKPGYFEIEVGKATIGELINDPKFGGGLFYPCNNPSLRDGFFVAE